MEIKRKTILDSKKYPVIMYTSLLIVSILILFSFVNLVEKQDKIKENIISPLTSFSIQEQSNLFNTAYLIYYLAITIIVISIFIVISKLKHNKEDN